MAETSVRCGSCGAERTFSESGMGVGEAIALWEQEHEREAHDGEEAVWEQSPNPFYS